MHRLLADVAFVLAALMAILALWPERGRPPGIVASWTLTPGVLNPDVRQDTIGSTICVSGWTRTVRPPTEYTGRLKKEQMRALGLPGTAADYQEDHLVSLELGGHPTDLRNLWPEPLERAEAVDRVENELHARVCSGELSLADAQRRISSIKHSAG